MFNVLAMYITGYYLEALSINVPLRFLRYVQFLGCYDISEKNYAIICTNNLNNNGHFSISFYMKYSSGQNKVPLAEWKSRLIVA